MKIKQGDILELSTGLALEVLEGESFDGVSGKLIVVEVDDENERIGEPYTFELSVRTPIIDIIR